MQQPGIHPSQQAQHQMNMQQQQMLSSQMGGIQQQMGMQQQKLNGNHLQMNQLPQQMAGMQQNQGQMGQVGGQSMQGIAALQPTGQQGQIGNQQMQHPGQSTSPKPNMLPGNVVQPQAIQGQANTTNPAALTSMQPNAQSGEQIPLANGQQPQGVGQPQPTPQLQQGQQPQSQPTGQPSSTQVQPSGGHARPSPPAWYNQDEHIVERRKMVTSIAMLLQQRKPNAPTEWMKKLPQMARRLEESLFREAESFDKYVTSLSISYNTPPLFSVHMLMSICTLLFFVYLY